ncbi:MAG: cation-transporting P-type ATPase [Halobacteriota archaeon]
MVCCPFDVSLLWYNAHKTMHMNEQPSWQQLETESLLQLLDTNVQGLSSLEAATRLKQYGPNRIEERKRVGKFCQAVRSIFF